MRYLIPAAIICCLIKTENGKRQILLQKRKNTGFADGMWDLSFAGHLEKGETLKECVVREGKEELNLSLKEDDLEFFALNHKKDGEIYYLNVYFKCENFCEGDIKILENKCEEVCWFPLDNLPIGIISDRVEALKHLSRPGYLQTGW